MKYVLLVCMSFALSGCLITFEGIPVYKTPKHCVDWSEYVHNNWIYHKVCNPEV